MKKFFVLILAVALLPVFALAEGSAEDVMAFIAAGDFDALYAMSDDAVQEQLGSAQGFEQAWAQIEAAFGAYASYSDVSNAQTGGYEVYSVTCDFANASATLTLAFDADGKLAGFTVANFSMKRAEAADEGGYVEEDVTLRPGEADETGGLLTLPEGDGPFPCVMMMQGSGPSDRNETAYGFPVFQALARALARRGVASVRYDKYTYAHAELIAGNAAFTVDDEYAYDAAAALELLRADARIGDIYLLGHSEGAMVAPRVAEKLGAEELSGLVLLAGSPLPLSEILMRQLKDMGVDEATLAGYRAQFDAMAGMADGALQAQTVLGASLYYWRDEADYDCAGGIVRLDLPVFIAQGEKDFQVLPAEGIEAYEAALSGFEGATYARYPDMTHLLADISGAMTGTAADYTGLDEIDEALADDVARWVRAR